MTATKITREHHLVIFEQRKNHTTRTGLVLPVLTPPGVEWPHKSAVEGCGCGVHPEAKSLVPVPRRELSIRQRSVNWYRTCLGRIEH